MNIQNGYAHNETVENISFRKENIMPVLTNFLPVQELEEEQVTKQKSYATQLKKFRKTVDLMSHTFDYEISEYSEIGQHILDKEAEVFQSFWDEVGFIPKDFDYSCLDTKMQYNYLSDLSQYPIVKVSELKKMANALSFVILPMSYINMDKIIEMYAEEDDFYAEKIRDSYNEFEEIVSNCRDYAGEQQLYMLAPISFYDPWEEVSSEELLPKYFPKKLHHLSTTLGMIMPTQRNLYKMIKTNEKNLEGLNETMQENFKAVEKSINECHKRIDWIEALTNSLESRVRSSEARANRMELQLYDMHLQVTKLEYMLYCLLDPIIFSVDADTDISDSYYDGANAHIGLCFGTDMPIDFFVEKGMTTINDKRLKSVTHVLKI